MKFFTEQDKYLFLSEINKPELFLQVSDNYQPSAELLELFIRKRRGLVNKLKDFKKSQASKNSWRKNRFKYLSGIRTFHKSTIGKRFHRELGRFISTREFSTKNKRETFEIHELLKALASARTHMLIENEYYHSVEDQVEFELFYEAALELLPDLEQSAIKNGDDIELELLEFLFTITEATALIKSFADKTGKSETEVENLWQKAKELAKSEYKKNEEDDDFYRIVVGILKRSLGV